MSDTHPESVAKRVLEMVFPGARMVFRKKQSNMEYDFDLHYANREVAAVEVTSSRNRGFIETRKRISNPKEGGDTFPAVKCRKSWHLLLFQGTEARKIDVRRIKDEAPNLLAELDAPGRESFDWSEIGTDNCPDCVTKLCKELGVNRGAVVPSTESPKISFEVYPSGGGATGSIIATIAGEREIDANKAKLGMATTNERHLVVYVDSSNWHARTVMLDFPPPAEKPNLPDEITHLWVITEIEKDRFIVWRGGSTEPWHTVNLPGTSQ